MLRCGWLLVCILVIGGWLVAVGWRLLVGGGCLVLVFGVQQSAVKWSVHGD